VSLCFYTRSSPARWDLQHCKHLINISVVWLPSDIKKFQRQLDEEQACGRGGTHYSHPSVQNKSDSRRISYFHIFMCSLRGRLQHTNGNRKTK
jgi:hypothetical protein